MEWPREAEHPCMEVHASRGRPRVGIEAEERNESDRPRREAHEQQHAHE